MPKLMRRSRRGDARRETLANLQLLRSCDPKELAQLARHSREVTLPAGTVLCEEGAPALEAFLILEGATEVTIGGRTVASLDAGDVVGETGLLDGGPRTATVTAVTPVRTLVLSASEFRTVLDAVPAVRLGLVKILAARVRQADRGSGLTVGRR